MNGDQPKPVKKKNVALRAAIGFGLVVLVVGAALYLSSDRFHARVRLKVIAVLEEITGGRTEMKSFTWNLSKLEVEIRDLTIHGLEGANEIPYAHVDRLLVRLKIISLFGRDIGLRYALAERPVIHLIVYPDGTTNQPTPKVKRERKGSPVDTLFNLAINLLEVKSGQLLLNDRRIPLDFAVNDFVAGMEYDLLETRYDGNINMGTMEVQYRSFRPLQSNSEIRFSLWPGGVELKALKWASARSSIEASGRMTDFLKPKIELTYNAALDLAELGEVTRTPQLRSGRLELNGSGSYQMPDFASTGKLRIRNVVWRARMMQAPAVDAGAQFSLTRERISLSDLSGQAWGGTLSGSAEVHNWLKLPSGTVSDPKLLGARQRGSANLRVAGIQLAAVAGAFSTRALPLGRMGLVGTAKGSVDTQWTGSPANAEAFVALDIDPPARPSPQQLPVNARLRLVYRGARQELEVAQLNLATRATTLSATGALGSSGSQMRFSLNTADLGEFEPVLVALQQPRIPAELQGRAAFHGTLSGKLAAPTLAGRLDVENFDLLLTSPTPPQSGQPTQGTAPAGKVPMPRRAHWDSLVADLQYSPLQIVVRNGMLRQQTASIAFGGRANLSKGKFTPSSPFEAHLRVRNAEVADLQVLAGYGYPITGTLTLNADVSGSQDQPRGGGQFQVVNGTAFGERFRSLRADLGFADGRVQLRNIALSQNGARVTGDFAYAPKSHEFRFELGGSNFDLAHFRQLQSEKLSIAGTAEFRANGSGTTESPTINADLSLRNLVLNGEEVGSLEAHAVTQGADMRLTARSAFENAELALDGNVRLRGDFPAAMTLRFAHLDVDPLLRAYLQGRITGHSSMGGAVDLRGPLRRPRLLNVSGHIDQFSMEVEKIRLQSDGPVRFTFADQVFTLQRLRLTGDGTDFSAGGRVELAGARQIELRADGRVNLKLLQTLDPDVLSSGMTRINVVAGGVLSQPEISGQVQISEGSVSFIDLPNGLSNISGVLVFDENRLRVQSLTAQSGGGSLDVGGFISWSSGLFFNLTAAGKDIRLRYPPGVSAVGDADLRLVGSPRSSRLTGEVTVTRFGINTQFDFALYLARSKQPPTVSRPDSPLNHLQLDIHIRSTPELQVQSSLAKVVGTADLRLRGTGVRPELLGRVNILEGDVVFGGTKYQLERGDILFANPTRIEPVLNLELTARVREYDIAIGFHGTPDKLRPTYRSDPPLPSQDIIALLALGRTREEAVLNPQPTHSFTETASNAVLGQALNTAVSSRVQKLFGVSRIKIDPEVGGPENNPNARVTIEQQVSNKVTLTFITNLTQSAQQIIQVEYNVNRSLSVVAVRDQNGVLGFDVRYRQRKR